MKPIDFTEDRERNGAGGRKRERRRGKEKKEGGRKIEREREMILIFKLLRDNYLNPYCLYYFLKYF